MALIDMKIYVPKVRGICYAYNKGEKSLYMVKIKAEIVESNSFF